MGSPEAARSVAIDYTVDLDCEPKRRFGLGGLAERLSLVEKIQSAGGASREQTSLLREVMFELGPVGFHCMRCPANHREQEFGCYGRVDTPISAEAEEWLMSLLPTSLTRPDPNTAEMRAQAEFVPALLDQMEAMQIPLRALDERRSARKSGAAELERKKQLTHTYGRLLKKRRISSDQLVYLLLYGGSIQPEAAEILCRALGIWQEGGLGEDGVPEVAFTQPLDSDDDGSIAQLKLLFYALMVACSLGVAVLTGVGGEV
jgi:hypothetical protein